jgi:D-amino-acid dehydrogenase
MPGTGSILVVGGGVIGVTSAYYLARRGFPVTLVERHDLAAGSSYGNSGLVVPSHVVPLAAPGVWRQGLRWMLDPESPFYIRPRLDPELVRWLLRFWAACRADHVERAVPVLAALSFRSRALYRELAAPDGFDFGYREDGALQVFRTAARWGAARHEADVLRAAGIGVELLDGPAAREQEPCLAPDVVGALSFPDDAHLVPDAFVTGLGALAEKLGVDIRRHTEVLGFRTARRRVIAAETTRGDLEAEQFVLAAGSWTPALARDLALSVPVQAAKGYSVTGRISGRGPVRPLLLGEARVAVTPMRDTVRFGGTLELAGLDLSVDRRRVAAIERAARAYLPGLGGLERLLVWRGLRPCTPDGLPILGRPAAWENLILATGHAMIGMSLGPVTGELVATLAAGESPPFDLAPLAPGRFDAGLRGSRRGEGDRRHGSRRD